MQFSATITVTTCVERNHVLSDLNLLKNINTENSEIYFKGIFFHGGNFLTFYKYIRVIFCITFSILALTRGFISDSVFIACILKIAIL